MKKHNSDKPTQDVHQSDKGTKNDDEYILQLQSQIEDLNAQLLRERADAMNVRRRAEEERVKLGSFYKALVVKEFLPAIDNLERALGSALRSNEQGVASKDGLQELVKGIESIYKQFAAALEKLGVEKIKTVGEQFDPELHEAVTMEEGDGDQEIVSEELQSGYKIGDEIIRHAMVRVRPG